MESPAFFMRIVRMANNTGIYSGAGRLRVHHLALEFCELIDSLLPLLVCSAALRDQLLRAAESVVLNIAEGAAHFSPGKKVYHYQLAHGSVSECLAVLARVAARNPDVDLRPARRKGEMIAIMLHALIKSQRSRPT